MSIQPIIAPFMIVSRYRLANFVANMPQPKYDTIKRLTAVVVVVVELPQAPEDDPQKR